MITFFPAVCLDGRVVFLVIAHAGPLPPGLAPFLATHFFYSLPFYRLFSLLYSFQGIAYFPSREESVELTGAVHLALDSNSAGDMPQVDAVAGLVDLLSALSTAPDKFFHQILFTDSQGSHALLLLGEFFRADHGIILDSPAFPGNTFF